MCRGVNLIIFEKHFRYRVNAPPIAISRAFSRTRKNNLEHIHMGYIKKKNQHFFKYCQYLPSVFQRFGTSKTKQCYCQQWRHNSCNSPIGKKIKNDLNDKTLDFAGEKKQNKTIGVHLTLTVSNSVWIASFSSNLHSLQRISNDEVHSLS